MKTTRYVIQNDASMYFENTLKPDVSVIISRPALSQENKKNFRIKVEAIQQRRRPHISAMRQAEYTKDEAAD